MMRHAAIACALVAFVVASARAQDFRWDKLESLGVKYRVIDKLEEVPVKLDGVQPNLRARYKPGRDQDFVRFGNQQIGWYLWVYEFDEELAAGRRDTAPNFAAFVHTTAEGRELREFVVKAKSIKKNKASGKKLPLSWWEYKDTQTQGLGAAPITWYVFAAVYDLDDREVVLVASVPATRGGKPEPKQLGWARSMLLSVTELKPNEYSPQAPDDGEIFEYARTKTRREAVEAAQANIKSLDNWGIFTTPNYIVLYSWPKGRADKRRRFLHAARHVSTQMERVRALYQRDFPPPTDQAFPYSIVRLCSTEDEFRQYSDATHHGLLGWFSPTSKELVLFSDNNRDQTMSVAFHEGWHQYADTYFGGTELHRWFDEGAGDYFGSFRWADGGWRYELSRLRRIEAEQIVNTNAIAPLQDLVTWPIGRFYGPDGSRHYAQAYSLFDFLMRGAAESPPGWDENWGSILSTYRDTILTERDSRKAYEAAFAGVDWDRLTKAWTQWVKEY